MPILLEKRELFVVRLPDAEDGSPVIRAFSVFSPQRGCKLRWDPEREYGGAPESLPAGKGVFFDPCGGAAFAVDGSYLFGPSPSGLQQLEATVSDGEVRVHAAERP